MGFLALLFRNPFLSGAVIIAVGASVLLEIQTTRLKWEKDNNATLSLRIGEYKSANVLLKETSRLREAAIIKEIEAERIRSSNLARKIEEIENDEDAPLPSIISDAIGRL